jgi:hypothetical protein
VQTSLILSLSHKNMMASSHDSFLNGLEVQLDDDIDAAAVESFWAFLSCGSPVLSAFEWILMMEHLGDPAHCETVGPLRSSFNGDVGAMAEFAISSAVGGGDGGALVSGNSDVSEQDPAADERAANVADGVCDCVGSVDLAIAMGSEMPAVASSGYESDSPHHQSPSASSNNRAAVAAGNNIHEMGFGLPQHESSGPHPAAVNISDFAFQNWREGGEGLASTSHSQFNLENGMHLNEAAVGRDSAGISPLVEELSGAFAERDSGQIVNHRSQSPPSSAATASTAHSDVLTSAPLQPRDNLSVIAASHSSSYSALCVLAQVTPHIFSSSC